MLLRKKRRRTEEGECYSVASHQCSHTNNLVRWDLRTAMTITMTLAMTERESMSLKTRMKTTMTMRMKRLMMIVRE